MHALLHYSYGLKLTVEQYLLQFVQCRYFIHTFRYWNKVREYDFNDTMPDAAFYQFTRIVWKGVTRIGCGYKNTTLPSGATRFVVIVRYYKRANQLTEFQNNVMPLKDPLPTPVPLTEYQSMFL